ncbi:MAG: outer membrane protein assembly factor BamB, partial [Pseudohongiellaceae bacterium]
NSPFTSLINKMKSEGDIQHTNTLELVDERLAQRLPEVSVGDALISCLYTNTIAVISMKTEQVVWARRGAWKWQHQPTVLENGNILLLDNKGGSPQLGRSRMLEIEPETGKFSWSYTGAEDNKFQTNTCGAGQRLPNGNTLITESDNGRSLEVTHEGQTVWEFLNPYRSGDDGQLVATLFEVVRLPVDFPTDWLGDD